MIQDINTEVNNDDPLFEHGKDGEGKQPSTRGDGLPGKDLAPARPTTTATSGKEWSSTPGQQSGEDGGSGASVRAGGSTGEISGKNAGQPLGDNNGDALQKPEDDFTGTGSGGE